MKGISNTFLQKGALPSLDGWLPDMTTPYNGSDRKEGLISPDGRRYLVKYAEAHTRLNDLDTSYVNNVISEYLSSHILDIAGFEVHRTFIGTRGEHLLVACENFTSDHQYLIEFGQYMRKHYDSGDIGRVPDIRQISHVLRHDPVLCGYSEDLWASYWERFIGDALVGNFDRHMGNWGYITDTKNQTIYPAPIYDNGSTLFPALSEKAMREDILPSKKELLKRTLLFPKAALTVNGNKAGYLDMLSSGYEPSPVRETFCPAAPRCGVGCPKASNPLSFHLLTAPYLPQHFLYFFPLPQGQGSFLPTFGCILLYVSSPPLRYTGSFFCSQAFL